MVSVLIRILYDLVGVMCLICVNIIFLCNKWKWIENFFWANV